MVAAALREQAAIEPALATERHLALALDPDDGELGPGRALRRRAAGDAVDRAAARRARGSPPAAQPGPALCTPRAAWLGRAGARAGRGRRRAGSPTESLTPFPPGVPAVLPGECLVPDVVATLRAVAAAGGVVHGTPDGLETFGVVAGRPPAAAGPQPRARTAGARLAGWTRRADRASP